MDKELLSSLSSPSMILKLRARSYDMKLSVSKVPKVDKDQHLGLRALSPMKRKRLEEFRDKDTLKTKIDRMSKILMRKMHLRFGSIYKETIQRVIERVLKPDISVSLTDDLIAHIEALIYKEIAAEDDVLVKKKQSSLSDKHTGNNNSRYSSNDPTSTAFASNTSGADQPNVPIGNEWQLLHLYDSLKHKENEAKQAEMNRMKKLKFKEALDQQIKVAKEIQLRQSLEKDQFAQVVIRDTKQHTIDEQQRKTIAKQKSKEEMRIRLQQIEESKQRKAKQMEEERLIAQEQIRESMEKLELEKKKQEEIRKKIQQTREEVTKNYEANKKMLELSKAKEREEDVRLMQEYNEKVLREERDRQMKFKARQDQSDLSSQRFMTDQMAKDLEKKHAEERLLLQEQQKKEMQDAALEQQKELERKKRLEQDRLENERIKEYHRRIELNELREKEILKQKYKEELENNKLESDESKRKKRFLQLQYRNVLISQMNSPGKEAVNRSMDRLEREYNMDLLKRASQELPTISTNNSP